MNIIMGDESFVNVVCTAAAEAITGTLTTINKTVKLAENEIDALNEAQQIRLDEVKFEREQAKAKRQAERDAA